MAIGGGLQGRSDTRPMERQRQRQVSVAVSCLLLAALLGTAGCGDTRRAFGLSRNAPDEFQVYKRQPLSMPPDYSLRPPTPGAPRPQNEETSRRAAEALFGGNQGATVASARSLGGGLPSLGGAPGLGSRTAAGGGRGGTAALLGSGATEGPLRSSVGKSASEVALLRLIEADRAVEGIRDLVDRETSNLVEANQSIIDDLLFWKDPKDVHTVLPAGEEAERLAAERRRAVRLRALREARGETVGSGEPATAALTGREDGPGSEAVEGTDGAGDGDTGVPATEGASAVRQALAAEPEPVATAAARAPQAAAASAAAAAAAAETRRRTAARTPTAQAEAAEATAARAFVPGQVTGAVRFGAPAPAQPADGGDGAGAAATDSAAQAGETAETAETQETDGAAAQDGGWSAPFGGTF